VTGDVGESDEVAESGGLTAGAAAADNTADQPPDLVDATRYDFDRLERAVVELARRYDLLQRQNGTLHEHLEDREAQIKRLEDDLASANDRRRQIAERLDALIDELDRLDAAFDASTAAVPNASAGASHDAMSAKIPSSEL
jgi:chromosome segregation ATPase